jgi:hypothetical protein
VEEPTAEEPKAPEAEAEPEPEKVATTSEGESA